MSYLQELYHIDFVDFCPLNHPKISGRQVEASEIFHVKRINFFHAGKDLQSQMVDQNTLYNVARS